MQQSQYAIPLVTNKRLVKKNEPFIETAKRAFNCTQNKPRLFHAVIHDVDSWKKTRRVIAKTEVMAEGTNNCFVVTHMDDEPQVIYDDFYTQRGDSENDIKELEFIVWFEGCGSMSPHHLSIRICLFNVIKKYWPSNS